MKKALLVSDVQNSIVNFADFTKEISLMEQIIKDFQTNNDPVIFMKHIDEMEESPLHRNSSGAELHDSLMHYADTIIEKQTPNSFYHTPLKEHLEMLNIEHLFIIGFNTEFCCLFTAIAAFDRGYQVTVIEDAIGTVNNAETYEMDGLDINDFIGTILDWSNVIEVLYHEEYMQIYSSNPNSRQ